MVAYVAKTEVMRPKTQNIFPLLKMGVLECVCSQRDLF